MKTLVKRLTLIALAIFCVAAMMLNTFAAVAGFDPIDPCSSANGTYCVYCQTENLYTDTTDRCVSVTNIGTAAVCQELEILSQRTYCRNCGVVQHEVYEYRKTNHPNRYYDEENNAYFCNACGFYGTLPE